MKILVSTGALALASVLAANVAFAADLPEAPMVPAPEMIDVSSDWSGLYIGGHVGYASGVVNWSTLPTGLFSGDYEMSGWVAGGQIGYNHQMDSLVVGADASLEWSGISGVDDVGAGFISREINWAGAVRGKLGFAVESILFYGAAGLAFANSTGHSFGPTEETLTHTGWTVGIGVEAKVTDDVSVYAEYDYTQYGWEDYLDYPIDTETEFNTQAVKFGANWHF
jgi:outer membrane autotransporter protein